MSSPSSAPADGFQAIQPGASQVVAYTGTAANSTAMAASIVRLYATTDCFVKISQAGTAATASDMILPATSVEYFVCHGGDIISVIQSSGAGSLYITQGA
jgi:hypothetical protein